MLCNSLALPSPLPSLPAWFRKEHLTGRQQGPGWSGSHPVWIKVMRTVTKGCSDCVQLLTAVWTTQRQGRSPGTYLTGQPAASAPLLSVPCPLSPAAGTVPFSELRVHVTLCLLNHGCFSGMGAFGRKQRFLEKLGAWTRLRIGQNEGMKVFGTFHG